MAIITAFTDNVPVTKLIGTNIVKAEVLIDFSATGASAGDAVEALNIPANAKVMEVHSVIVTAEGDAGNIDIGDGAGTDSWDANVDINAAAATAARSLPGTDAYATTGKFYAAADTIDVIPSINVDTAKIVVSAVYMMLEKY